MNANNETSHWSLAMRISFRFAFAYLVLYNLFGGNSLLRMLWDGTVTWVGRHVFHAEVSQNQFTGSGDTAWCYVQVFCFFVLSVAATAIWTILDRKRRNYTRLHDWLTVLVRYSLAMSMIIYGAVKAIPTQFASPSPDLLVQSYGDGSPMRLLWTFMGSSIAYVIFTGLAELLGGFLLTTRRTTLLGALICIGVMANVVMLNFCYDVPVKLLSTHLLVMSVFLILPDLRRMFDLFVLNRKVEPVQFRPLFANPWLQRGGLILRTMFVLGFTSLHLLVSLVFYVADVAARPPQYGVWNVESFEVDGQERPPLLSDSLRWRRLTFDSSYDLTTIMQQAAQPASDGNRRIPGTVSIYRMNDERQRYAFELNQATREMALTSLDDADTRLTISCDEPKPDVLVLQGTFEGQNIVVTLRRVQQSEFLLTSRGFHWINEFPFNV